MDLPLQIDSSMLTCFRSCPKKFYHEYVLCLRPRGRHLDLVAGGAFAAALERAYQEFYVGGASESVAIARSFKSFRRAWGDFVPDGDPAKSLHRMFGAVCFYFDRFGLDRDHFQPFKAEDRPTFEYSFAVPLTDPHFPLHPTGQPFLYTGRFDAFGHLNGLVAIRDEKTTGRNFTHDWSEQWNLRNQFLGYCWASQRLGYPTQTVAVRGICIQKTQYNVTEAIKTYPRFMLERFESQLARDLHRLVAAYTEGYWDYNLGDSCTAYGRPCAFSLLCSSARPEVWYGEYDRERWDPLTRTTVPLTNEREAA